MLTQANDHRIAIEIMLAEKYEYFKINLKINLYFSQWYKIIICCFHNLFLHFHGTV